MSEKAEEHNGEEYTESQHCEDARQSARECDDTSGHVWAEDYTDGDTCYCGGMYLMRDAKGRMKVTDR